VTLNLAGQTMYVIFDVDLALPIFRSFRNFSFDPITILIIRALGCTRSDLKVLNRGANVITSNKDVESKGKEGFLWGLHHLSTSAFRGEGLDAMTEVFINQLRDRIETCFPSQSHTSYEWKEMELVSFIVRLWTLSSIASLFGTGILKREGEDWIIDWLWGLDPSFTNLLTLLPDFMLKDAARRRDEGLEMMIRWERHAKASGRWEKERTAGEWDEELGLKFCKDRTVLGETEGLSERGRAATQVALIWG
jgi:hypothetical protein